MEGEWEGGERKNTEKLNMYPKQNELIEKTVLSQKRFTSLSVEVTYSPVPFPASHFPTSRTEIPGKGQVSSRKQRSYICCTPNMSVYSVLTPQANVLFQIGKWVKWKSEQPNGPGSNPGFGGSSLLPKRTVFYARVYREQAHDVRPACFHAIHSRPEPREG